MVNYVNYFLNKKFSRLTQGHLKADQLYDHILGHNGLEAYCCYFDLDENYLKLEWDTGAKDGDGKTIYEYHLSGQSPKNPNYKCNGKTFTKYEGIARPSLGCISFDFDDESDPANAMDDVKKFVEWLDIKDVAVFFSGSKGFHVMIPQGYFPLEANEHLPNQLKDLAKHLKEFFPTLDDSIYNYSRKFRAPFTQHDKSGLYKNFVPVDYLFRCEIEDIIEEASQPNKFDFLQEMGLENFRESLTVIVDALENSARKSYEIEKDRAGTIEAPSPFEKFDGKLCISKMLESRCDDIGRNNACMRIVNDYFRTGKTQSKCEKDVFEWSKENGLAMSEVSTIISNIYERGGNYNFGCQDECKSVYCSAKCSIWKKLDPDKRPMTVDMPVSAETSTKMKNEFVGVTWLMENIFGCSFNDVKQCFNDGLIVKQDAVHLFYYKEKHWQHLDESKVHILKTKLNAQYENKLTTRKLDAVFKMFVLYVPEVPEDVDLFAPRNDMANFLDGTLHLERSKEGQFQLAFKEHVRTDFCTTMIELNYADYLKNIDVKNNMFEEWLFEYLGNDGDSFKLVQEMFGASLLPKFPQFFVLIGKSGTGKSTTIKVLKQLHKNDKNISGVSPDKFHGFHMASMIGKLINIVGDIKTNCKIDDDIVKQVDDQEVVRIEIKSQADVYTKLPALHIFGANKMPSTSEGYSGAMKRRFSIVNFDKQFTGKKNTEIAKDMFLANPLGILAFSLRGLDRLICENNGEYTKTEKSQENVDKWSKKSDVIWRFLKSAEEEAIEVGGNVVEIKIKGEGKIMRSKLCSAFKAWQDEYIDLRSHIGKMEFLDRLSDIGFYSKRGSNGWNVLGISEAAEADDRI